MAQRSNCIVLRQGSVRLTIGENELTQGPSEVGTGRNWALVTGASAGIGAEFCRQLAARDYDLILVARREDRLNHLAGELQRDFGTSSHVFALDLSSPTAGSELAAKLDMEGLKVEFLVNNAGYGLPGHFTAPSWDSHERFIQVMITSVCDLTWRLLPHMQAQKKGFIVNVASLAGLVPGSAGHTLYGASKAFLVRYSESLALENTTTGVHVSALCPGFTYSEFHDVTGTRELVSKMPAWMWMSAEAVVAFGIQSVSQKNPVVVAIPGRINRMIARLMRWLPPAWAHGLTRQMSGQFRAQNG